MKNLLYHLTCIAFLVCWIPELCNAQQMPVLRLDTRVGLHVQNGTIMFTLNLLGEKGIPIGIEFSNTEKNEPKLNIDVEKAPLLKVLNLIVQQEPTYVWELRDGVINFTPVQNRDVFFEKLLNTPIRSFQSSKRNNKFSIREALVNLPEIKQLIIANGAEADVLGYPHRPSIYANDADLSDKNLSFRSLLNKIIRDSEHNGWVLQWLDRKKKLFEIGL